MQQRNEPPPDQRIGADAVVGAHVRGPEIAPPRRLGPEAKDVVIVIFQNNPATGPHRADHVLNHGEGIGYVLEHEAGMGDVEAPPFIGPER